MGTDLPAVLVVEDDEDTLELLCRELEPLAVRLERARTGTGAHQLLTRERFGVLLTDIVLPGMDGLALARWCRKHHPDTVVILITGHASLESAIEALRLGVREYLLKPLEQIEVVRRSVSLALESHTRLRRSSSIGSRLLELVPLPALMVDGDERVNGWNSMAKDFVARRGRSGGEVGTGVSLCELMRCDERLLRECLQRACGLSEAGIVGTVRLRADTDSVPATPVVVVGLGQVDGSGLAVVVIGDRAPFTSCAAQAVQATYGLTAAETRVALQVVAGRSPEETAAVLGTAVPTVRTHLQRLFAKTETTRQAQLVGALLGGPVLLHLPTARAEASPSAIGSSSWPPAPVH